MLKAGQTFYTVELGTIKSHLIRRAKWKHGRRTELECVVGDKEVTISLMSNARHIWKSEGLPCVRIFLTLRSAVKELKVKRHTKIIIVSTPNSDSGAFARLQHLSRIGRIPYDVVQYEPSMGELGAPQWTQKPVPEIRWPDAPREVAQEPWRTRRGRRYT